MSANVSPLRRSQDINLPGPSTSSQAQETEASSASSERRCGGRVPDTVRHIGEIGFTQSSINFKKTTLKKNHPLKILQKFRTLNEMVIGLPKFGEKSLQELGKIRMHMRMHSIYEDCKSHVRRKTKGDEYLSRKEWNSYTRDICDVYPNLKSEGENYWVNKLTSARLFFPHLLIKYYLKV